MGIRLEYSIIFLCIVTVVLTMNVKLERSTSNVSNSHKELAFKNTTFIEVDTQKMQSRLYTPYGVRENGILHLKKIHYSTPQIDSLLADEGRYKNNILYLDGNIILKETIGNIYKSQHAVYNQKSEILTVTSPFIAYMGQNIYKGDTLVYDAIHKEVNATQIDAVIYPDEK